MQQARQIGQRGRWWAVLGVAAAIASGGSSAAGQCGSWVNGFGVPGMNGIGVITVHAWDRDGVGPQQPTLVVGGAFFQMNGVDAVNVARFDPATNVWSSLGDVGIPGFHDVRSFATMPNGDLVAGGSLTVAGGTPANRVARFNGVSWSALGDGVSGGTSPQVEAMAVMPNGDLVVGGQFTTAGSTAASNIARWNGSSWSALGSGLSGGVKSMVVMPNGDLIVGGDFTSAGGVPGTSRIARWNGSSWSALGTGSVSSVYALAVLADGSLIAPVNFSGSSGLCRWTGTAWANFSGGPINNTIYSLVATPDGGFVVGGVFSGVGSLSSPGIVRRIGSSWVPLGAGTNGGVFGLTLISGNDLYLGGAFNNAGGSPAGRIARHTLGAALSVVDGPDDAAVTEGATLTLSAAPGAGFTNVSVRWQRNGVNINNGAGGASVGGGTVSGALGALASPTNGAAATLTITNVKLSDAGSYSAVFTGDCGGVSSAAATVTVATAPCPADYNGDGSLNLDDLSDFITDFYADPPIPGGLQPEAPTYANVVFPSVPCPNAPEANFPYDLDAYQLLGYRVAFSPDGSNACPADPGQTFPNLDNLSDFITEYYAAFTAGGC